MYLIRFSATLTGGVMKVRVAQGGYCLGILATYAVTMVLLVRWFWIQDSTHMTYDDAVALVLVKGVFFGILLGIGALTASIYGHLRLFNKR